METDGRTRIFTSIKREEPIISEAHPSQGPALSGQEAQEVLKRVDYTAHTAFVLDDGRNTVTLSPQDETKPSAGLDITDLVYRFDEIRSRVAAAVEEMTGETGLTIMMY